MDRPECQSWKSVAYSARELMDILARLDPDAPVVVRYAEGGYGELRQISVIGLKLGVNTLAGFGPHDLPEAGTVPDVRAVALTTEPPWGVAD